MELIRKSWSQQLQHPPPPILLASLSTPAYLLSDIFYLSDMTRWIDKNFKYSSKSSLSLRDSSPPLLPSFPPSLPPLSMMVRIPRQRVDGSLAGAEAVKALERSNRIEIDSNQFRLANWERVESFASSTGKYYFQFFLSVCLFVCLFVCLCCGVGGRENRRREI